jgi:hypothetical protein
MPCITVSKEIDIDVDIEEFDDHDLLDELESRGLGMSSESIKIIEKIWQLRRTNQPYDHLMDDLIGSAIGKLV